MHYRICIALALALMIPTKIYAQTNAPATDVYIQANIMEIIETRETPREDGSISVQQKIKLEGLTGEWKKKEFLFDGMEYDVLTGEEYRVGDRVIVNITTNDSNEHSFYILGYSRTRALLWLTLLFTVIVVLIGRAKGLRSLLVLLLTFIVILKFIVPNILTGANPLLITIIGAFVILVTGIYITEGVKRSSTIAIGAITISLVITGLLSIWFSAATKLTGFASEEASYLVGFAAGNINIKGLLLAGIIIGALGILDDVIIAQVALVEELKIANPSLSKLALYTQAMRVGVSHMSSLVNTLFLAYAGASLPLLMLFSIKEPPFLTFSQVVDNEIVATEIVRTLTGSIGVVLAVPIVTLLSVYYLNDSRISARPYAHAETRSGVIPRMSEPETSVKRI